MLKITGTGRFLPSFCVTNEVLFNRISNFDMERASFSLRKKGIISDTLEQKEIFGHWVEQVTGIKQRHYISEADHFLKNYETEVMAEKASLLALEDANLGIENIDYIIFTTYTSHNICPPPVCKLKDFLSIENTEVAGITMNSVCNGFLDAVIDAAAKIKAGMYKRILIVASEYTSRKLDYANPTTSILFGDGAAACIVEKDESVPFAFDSHIKFSNSITMTDSSCLLLSGGPLVEKNAVKSMNYAFQKCLEKSNLSLEEIEYIIPHQANTRILHELAKKTGAPDKHISTIDKTGNLSSASIPYSIDELRKGNHQNEYKKNKLAVLVALGSGYAYGATIVRLG